MRWLAGLAIFLVGGLPVDGRDPVRSRQGMVSAEEPLAVDVGVRVLQSGGNAIDAAVAVGLALGVTYPSAGNLGGGGFLLARFADGKTSFVDFREMAPRAASRDMYLVAGGKLGEESKVGWRASGVPGTVKGLALAHQKYGSKPWAELVEPAMKLASEGFRLPYQLAESMKRSKLLARFPESARVFQRNGKFYETGDLFRQPELAVTLGRIARDPEDFYRGETARKLAEAMKSNAGSITLEDLAGYKAVERTPLRGSYKGYEVITAPPPSSGGIGILQMLGVLEGSGYEKSGSGAAATIHVAAETMKRFYADRSEFMADPDFFKVPVKGLLDPAYIAKLRASISLDKAVPSAEVRPAAGGEFRESEETTQISIVDEKGNAVSLTYTINGGYGSGVTVPGLGFLLNNEMDDFAAKPGSANMFGLVQGEGNAIQPGKRPLSAMTPTILLRDGKLFLVVGGPGGGRIITSVLQTILNVVDFGMNIQDAIDRPRFHHQWQPDVLTMESGISPDTIDLLKRRGHKVEVVRPAARVFGVAVKGDYLEGAADGRTYGKAAGY